jgi:SEC-C motif
MKPAPRARDPRHLMASAAEPPIPTCLSCGALARRNFTQYGVRDACDACKLWSWHGKELVSEKVNRGRDHCHEKINPLWQDASWVDTVAEHLGVPGTPERKRTVRKVQKRATGWTYAYLAAMLSLPEPEVHMRNQTDVPTLRRIWALAARTTPADIRAWAQAQGWELWRAPLPPSPPPTGPSLNRPCPCGSGRKFKKCKGTLAAPHAIGAPELAGAPSSAPPGQPPAEAELDVDAPSTR